MRQRESVGSARMYEGRSSVQGPVVALVVDVSGVFCQGGVGVTLEVRLRLS